MVCGLTLYLLFLCNIFTLLIRSVPPLTDYRRRVSAVSCWHPSFSSVWKNKPFHCLLRSSLRTLASCILVYFCLATCSLELQFYSICILVLGLIFLSCNWNHQMFILLYWFVTISILVYFIRRQIIASFVVILRFNFSLFHYLLMPH